MDGRIMTPATLLALVIRPTLAAMNPRLRDVSAERLLVAIALQESGLAHRRQVGGPARGFWQFERAGVAGVLLHRASAADAADLATGLVFPATLEAVYSAIENNDTLACGMARLLLWTDPAPLPTDEAGAWAYYLRCWRPGKPHRERWGANWNAATRAIYGG
jgi:hypothetical protein